MYPLTSPAHIERFKAAAESNRYAFFKYGKTMAAGRRFKVIRIYHYNDSGDPILASQVFYHKDLFNHLKMARYKAAKAAETRKAKWGKFE